MTDDRPSKPTPLEVRPDAIPDTLTSRDQWVTWEYQWREPKNDDKEGKWTKVPVNPQTGRFAKSSDPDTWTSFADAYAYHEENDTDGIGFVTSDADNIVGVDLDDCRDPETGDLTEWAEDIIDSVPTYTEISQSETGIRQFGLGVLPDSGRKGDIEMYDDGRYLTVTGHQYDDTPTTCEDVDEAITDVYERYIADDEATEEGVPETDSLPDDELLDKARNADNGEKFRQLFDDADISSYETHSEADLALCGLLAFWTGGDREQIDRLFRESALYRGKWDRDDYRKLTIDKALDGRSDYYDGRETSTPSETNLSEHEGRYGYWSRDGDDWSFQQVTNFTLTTNAILETGDEIRFDLTVDPIGESSYTVQITADGFNDRRAFLQNVVTGATTTVDFPRPASQVLNDLRRLVGYQDAPRRKGVSKMGIHGDEFVTPNGVLGPDGWKDDPDHLFTGDGNEFFDKFDLSPETDVDRDELKEILRLLPKTRSSDRFLPVLTWFYAAPLRPLIMKWENEFNHLSIFGHTGSGKTSTLELMWRLFGMDGEPVSSEGTTFTRLRTLSATNSIPVWFDEYRPANMGRRNHKSFHQHLRSSSKGETEYRGNPDQSTTAYPLSAPAVISGEEHLQGEAEQRRTIMVDFLKNDTDAGTPTRRAFMELSGGSADGTDFEGYDLTQHALAYYQWLLQHRGEVRKLWNNARGRVNELIDEELGDTPRRGLQTIVFGFNLYMSFATEIGVQQSELPTEDDAHDAVRYAADQMLDDELRKSHLDEFFELASDAAMVDYLNEDEQYTVVKEGTDAEELRINISRTFPQVRKYVRDHDLNVDVFDKSADYTSRCREIVNEAGTHYVTMVNQNSPPVGRCVGIQIDLAEDALNDFTKGKFTVENEPTAIADLSQGGGVTVTGEIISVRRPDGEQIAQSGTIEDTTGRIRFVIWDDCPDRVEEDDCYRFENVEIDDFQGETQVYVGDRSNVERIQQGAELTPAADTEDESLDDVTVKGHIRELLQLADGGLSREKILTLTDGDTDYDEDTIDNAIDSLIEHGRVIDDGDVITLN